jgi:hypothetical protein
MMANGQRVGYIRVSSVDQNTDRQLDGVHVDRCFTDKASGKDILVCEDFAHLGATCCPVCHLSFPDTDMYLIDLPQGRRRWICDQVRWALHPEERGKLRPWNWSIQP